MDGEGGSFRGSGGERAHGTAEALVYLDSRISVMCGGSARRVG